MPLPSGLTYATVRYQIITPGVDTSSDADALPDAIVPTGSATITIAEPYLLTTIVSPKVTIIPQPMEYFFDSVGVLRDQQGNDLIGLLATDSTGITPVPFQYRLTVNLNNGTFKNSFYFYAPTGVTTDLTAVSPMPYTSPAVLVADLAAHVAAVDPHPVYSDYTEINAQTAAYTLVITDDGKAIHVTSATAVAVTVPPNSSAAFVIGAHLDIVQTGAGQLTIAPGSGVTLRSRDGFLKTASQYAAVRIRKIATDEWLVIGDLVT